MKIKDLKYKYNINCITYVKESVNKNMLMRINNSSTKNLLY